VIFENRVLGVENHLGVNRGQNRRKSFGDKKQVKNVGDKPGTNLGTKITRAEMTTYRNKQGYFEQSGTKRGQLRGQNKNA